MASAIIKCESSETEQPQSPKGEEVFSPLKEKNGPRQNNTRKRHFEKVLFADFGVSPRKAARKGNEEDNQCPKMTDLIIVERENERLREYCKALAEKSATSGHIMPAKCPIVKKELIDKLKLRSDELKDIFTNDVDSTNDGSTDRTKEDGRTNRNNDDGSTSVTNGDDSTNGTKEDDNTSRTNDDGNTSRTNDDGSFSGTNDDSTNGTNGDGKLLKEHGLHTVEASSTDETIGLHQKIHNLETKLIDAEITIMNEKIKFTENLANTQVMIVVENKVPPAHHNTELLQLMQDKLKDVSDSYCMLKECITQFPKLIHSVMADTMLKMQSAIRSTDENYKELLGKYTREIQLRKHYHNLLVELRGNIRVFCRVRPCKTEGGLTESVMSFDPFDDGIIVVNNKGRCQKFQMDKVFNMNVSQSQMFDEVSSFVRSAIDGFNVCIFAYGQTGSGKTHTMEGVPSDPGVNQRALHLLYEEMKTSSWQYRLEISMLEIYNEALIDLLNPDQNSNTVEVKMKPEGGFHIPGLVTVPVNSVHEVNKIIEMGSHNRAKATTCMNEKSSRSHCLLCVNVAGVNLITGSKTFGRLNLVDLAGSERVSRSQADGVRLKEAKNINKSLSSLGDVISALKNKHAHVPYRNSKLTYLLQESLGGDSKTLMILQVSPEEDDLNESICTLSFGQRVRSAELGAAKRKVEEGNVGLSTPARCPNTENINSPMGGTPVKQTPNPSKASPLPSKLIPRFR